MSFYAIFFPYTCDGSIFFVYILQFWRQDIALFNVFYKLVNLNHPFAMMFVSPNPKGLHVYRKMTDDGNVRPRPGSNVFCIISFLYTYDGSAVGISQCSLFSINM